MTQHFYIGVDGGATKCVVRLEDAEGRLLGRETGGPSSLRFSPANVWQAIYTALNRILQQQGLSLTQAGVAFHAGMGLAGSEITAARDAFVGTQHPFKTLVVTSDAHTACLGAHAQTNGAVIIAGTGVVGYQIQQEVTAKVGGFGFPHDDEGGGAWLGLQAVKATVQWLDGRLPVSGLAQAVYAYFNENKNNLINWANSANATVFAELAPLVIAQSERQDTVACGLMREAAFAIDRVAAALQQAQVEQTAPLPCALVGGVAPFLINYLSTALRERLTPVRLTPDAGAILLVRGKQND